MINNNLRIITVKYTCVVTILLMLIFNFIFMPNFSSYIDFDSIFLSCIFGFLAIIAHFVMNHNRGYFRIDTLFILGFVIVHFQWPAMLALSGVEPQRMTELSSNFMYMNYGTWLSSLGICFWLFAYNLFDRRKAVVKEAYPLDNRMLFYISSVLLISFILAAGRDFLTGAVYKESGSADAISGLAGYILIFLHISMLTLCVTEIHNSSLRGAINFSSLMAKSSKAIIALIVFYILIFLSAGDRGGPLQVVITIFLVYSVRISPIGGVKFIALGAIGAIILSILGIFRAAGAEGVGSVQVNSLYDLTINLANSARTIYIGLAVVPESVDYFYGKMWLGNILGIFPFFQSLYLDFSGDKAYMLNSATYITYLRYGEHPTTGEGTALIIDIFMNFGLIGVVFFMSLFGMFCKYLQSSTIRANSFGTVLAFALVGCTALYMGRATYFIYLQTLIWGLLFYMVFVKRKEFS